MNHAVASAAAAPTLRGQRCTLRTLQVTDAPALQRHADDPEVAYNLFDDFPQPYTLADAEAWCGDLHREPQFGTVWGIEVSVEGATGPGTGTRCAEIAGCISVAAQKGLWSCSALIGYWLGQAHWRRGIVSEALALVTAWSWANLPQTTRLWMPIYARNAGSQAVAARCGYRREGFMPYSIRKAGAAIDAMAYGAYRPGLPSPPIPDFALTLRLPEPPIP